MSSSNLNRLQLIHVQSNVVMDFFHRISNMQFPPSINPRPVKRGNRLAGGGACPDSHPSINPRPVKRGNPTAGLDPARPSPPSINPRPVKRGNVAGAAVKRATRFLLQLIHVQSNVVIDDAGVKQVLSDAPSINPRPVKRGNGLFKGNQEGLIVTFN